MNDNFIPLLLAAIHASGNLGMKKDTLLTVLKPQGYPTLTEEELTKQLFTQETDQNINGIADRMNRNVTRYFITSKGQSILAECGLL